MAVSGVAAVSGKASTGPSGLAAWRADSPITRNRVYFNSASAHSVSIHSALAMKRYLDYLTTDPTR